MNEFTTFVRFGFRHITDVAALDHLLFLIALVASYRWRDWRHLLVVASAFTLGHSITLGLAVTGVLRFPTAIIEFLIPVTIVGAGLANLRRSGVAPSGWLRPALAGGFGLIHGAGFANYLHEMLAGPAGLPLLAFNLGIEAGQLVILALGLTFLSLLDHAGSPAHPDRRFRLRAIATSLVAAVWAGWMAAGRLPW